MQVTAKLRNLRTAPRKVRQVVDLIRGKKVVEAQSVLLFTVNKPARDILKLLNSAVASASHNFSIEESNLYIYKILVDEGPTLKRSHPMSRGRAYPINKRTSHITIVLSEIDSLKSKGIKNNKRKEKNKKTNLK